jgi:hypothetical protein
MLNTSVTTNRTLSKLLNTALFQNSSVRQLAVISSLITSFGHLPLYTHPSLPPARGKER